MKTKLIILLLFCGMLGAEEKSTGDGRYLTDPNLTRLIVQVIDSVTVSNWLEVKGEKSSGSIGASVASPTQFKPEDTTIVAKREPVVTKRDDGTWAITFPKDVIQTEWTGYTIRDFNRPSHYRELGFRSDGTVMWREVKP